MERLKRLVYVMVRPSCQSFVCPVLLDYAGVRGGQGSNPSQLVHREGSQLFRHSFGKFVAVKMRPRD
jgi:hypothetical protein